jgi:hypothetical protein
MTAQRQSCRCCGVVDGCEFLGGIITSDRQLSDEEIFRLAEALRAPLRNVIVMPAGAKYEPAAVLTTYWVEPDLCAFCATTRTLSPASTPGAYA